MEKLLITIIFEFENMMHLFRISLQKRTDILPSKNAQNVKILKELQICMQLFCDFYKTYKKTNFLESLLFFKENTTFYLIILVWRLFHPKTEIMIDI